jgi:hypothetical protein
MTQFHERVIAVDDDNKERSPKSKTPENKQA